MKSTRYSIILICIAAATGSSWHLLAQENEAKPTTSLPLTQVGRFQLFQGTFTSIDGKDDRTYKDSGIFMIDTLTGNVKAYRSGLTKEGKLYEGWNLTTRAE